MKALISLMFLFAVVVSVHSQTIEDEPFFDIVTPDHVVGNDKVPDFYNTDVTFERYFVTRLKHKKDILEGLNEIVEAEKIKNDAEALAANIGDLTLKVGAKVGESGKIFGAVTTLQISDLLADKGYEIDRKQISFPVQPKEVGEFVALLDLHKEVKHEVKFEVVSE